MTAHNGLMRTDEQVMFDVAADYSRYGTLPTDGEARVVASQWHGGQVSALYSLASCGAIRDDCADEIAFEFYKTGARELLALLAYVKAAGERGPVKGWATY